MKSISWDSPFKQLTYVLDAQCVVRSAQRPASSAYLYFRIHDKISKSQHAVIGDRQWKHFEKSVVENLVSLSLFMKKSSFAGKILDDSTIIWPVFHAKLPLQIVRNMELGNELVAKSHSPYSEYSDQCSPRKIQACDSPRFDPSIFPDTVISLGGRLSRIQFSDPNLLFVRGYGFIVLISKQYRSVATVACRWDRKLTPPIWLFLWQKFLVKINFG